MADTATIERKSVDFRNLSRYACSANGFTQWHYRTAQLSTALEPGHFTSVDCICEGDHIAVSADDGGALLYVGRTGVKVMAQAEDV